MTQSNPFLPPGLSELNLHHSLSLPLFLSLRCFNCSMYYFTQCTNSILKTTKKKKCIPIFLNQLTKFTKHHEISLNFDSEKPAFSNED